jgi:small subunit ribosomal protein S6
MEDRLYEVIFISRPDTPEAEIDKIIATLQHAAEEKSAKLEKIEKWGRKRMAYKVHKLREGYYVAISLRTSQGELIKELERRLKVSDPVIKYLTIRIDEDLKRQQKLAKHRERRAARRPRKPAPAPSSTPSSAAPPAPPATPTPAAPATGGGESAPAAS